MSRTTIRKREKQRTKEEKQAQCLLRWCATTAPSTGEAQAQGALLRPMAQEHTGQRLHPSDCVSCFRLWSPTHPTHRYNESNAGTVLRTLSPAPCLPTPRAPPWFLMRLRMPCSSSRHWHRRRKLVLAESHRQQSDSRRDSNILCFDSSTLVTLATTV